MRGVQAEALYPRIENSSWLAEAGRDAKSPYGVETVGAFCFGGVLFRGDGTLHPGS